MTKNPEALQIAELTKQVDLLQKEIANNRVTILDANKRLSAKTSDNQQLSVQLDLLNEQQLGKKGDDAGVAI